MRPTFRWFTFSIGFGLLPFGSAVLLAALTSSRATFVMTLGENLLVLGYGCIVFMGFVSVMLLREIIRDERERARLRRERQVRRQQAIGSRPRHRVARRGWGALSQDRRAA
ncbi:hypothetical protein [Longimicrobium terrae]|uniref:Uncharacterized protein n=1 Tax=Longimicrobium terrae TaxID=1639882 RepID=A0A841H3M2_9BACT|nr:hypothetical protein [Longimicrobium terrae]MBB4638047.1 hypothetical protein [Longimicrobium terrae]MBB6072419.1 hypothetical protein [Longimicrobium terrae]NNC32167.1 hypothetical protein [Longimicrobium terrae]